MRTCRRCQTPKAVDRFAPYVTRQGKPSFRRTCRDCVNDARRARVTRSTQRVYEYRSKYGVEMHEIEALLVAQLYRCPVCTLPVAFPGNDLDHDHETGKPRGVLHRRCNMLLGYAKDNPERLENAAAYLRSLA